MCSTKRQDFCNPLRIMKTTTRPLEHSKNRLHCPLALLIIALAVALIALAPATRAQCPQVCEDSSTGLGFGALQNNSIGVDNTAVGTDALYINTTGYENT